MPMCVCIYISVYILGIYRRIYSLYIIFNAKWHFGRLLAQLKSTKESVFSYSRSLSTNDYNLQARGW